MTQQTTGTTPEKIVLRFRTQDSEFGVTRKTTQRLATTLGLSETQLVHRALASFARHNLPQYEADDGPLTAAQLKAIRSMAPQEHYTPTQSLIPGL